MKPIVGIGLLLMALHCSYAPPVTTPKPVPGHDESQVKDDLGEYMEYHRYLKEVIQALESDNDFREKLEKADDADIKTGKIADQLDFVSHQVRTQLDEIKRREMERLRHLATREFELTNNLDRESLTVSSAHLDHENPHTFEIEDLKKLIKKTTDDLAEADKKRREEFKEYEMQKEFEKHQKVEGMSEQEKKEFEERQKAEKEQHKRHPKVHNPGSRQQLEEVWEKQDHMENQEFNPKVFFMMHDLDGNGVWDADEVKALFIKELDKIYSLKGNQTDLRERQEEMERMREYVFQTSDTNRDGLIDYNEFLLQTKRNEFQNDPEWKGIDENEIYTQQEYQEFERRRLEELRYLQERGMVDAHGRPIPQYHPQQYPNNHPNQPQFQPLPPQTGQYYQPHPNSMPNHPNQPPMNQVYQQGYPPQGHIPQMANVPVQNVQQQGYGNQQMPNQAHASYGQQAPNQGQQPPVYNQQMPNQGQQIHNQGQPIPNQGQPIPNQGQPIPNQGQPIPNQGQPMQNQGQQNPNQGQVPQQNQPATNQVNPAANQVPQAQDLPQGQAPPQANPHSKH